MKKWTVKRPDLRLAADMKKKCDLSMTAIKLMIARGYEEFEQLADFFSGEELESPFDLADMDKAVEVINAHIDRYDLICVYGDYDCDGITSTALLYNYLVNIGANVIYHINERSEGYGMNIDAIRALRKRGVELIITVDNGISCVEEAQEIIKLGMKLVITDHHQPPEELPQAEALIDPLRPDCPSKFKKLAGVGVALKLCAALDEGSYEAVLEQYSDICSIGTVGDIVSLTGENRTIVRKGLMYLRNTENYGLNELMNQAEINRSRLSAGVLAFQICPRINAAGRFASPTIALEALLTEDPEAARESVSQLVSLNEKRRSTEREIFEEIKQTIDKNPQILNRRVLVISGKGWHHGVIGIVSSKVLEAYGKPNIIISVDEDGGARGSARSLKGFNIHKCLTYASEYLEKFGGHECAGGLSLSANKIAAFDKAVQEYAAQAESMPVQTTDCDIIIEPDELTVENIRSLDVLQPFGAGNPQPVFCLPNCRVSAIYPLSGGKHTKLDITYRGVKLQALVFSKSPQEMFFGTGDFIDIAAQIEVNEFGGRESLSVKVSDIIPHGLNPAACIKHRELYEAFKLGAKLSCKTAAEVTPTRKELVFVYKTLAAQGADNIDTLYMRTFRTVANYCKLRIIIDIFAEAGLVKFSASERRAEVVPANSKANLEAVPTMTRLHKLSAAD